MKVKATGTRAAAALLAFVLISSLWGCAGGGAAKNEYILEKDGVKYGTQVVESEETDGNKVVYSSTERFPYYFQDTTVYRSLTFSGDMETVLGYYSNRKVPGASFRTYITRDGELYVYLSDELQTFRYVPDIYVPGRCFPLETDSVCLLQGITGRFLDAGVEEAVAFVIVPSMGPVVQKVMLEREEEEEEEIILTGELLGEVTISVDDDGVITGVRDSISGLEITRGKAGRIESEPYEADAGGVEVKNIAIEIPDKEELAGSLYIPGGRKPYPAVILAGDFGPQDRTGDGVLSQIAVRLAREGMAVLTCDKRGIPQSEGSYATYTFDTAREDLDDQVDYMVMRGDMDIDRIGVLGYGEGGALLAAVAPSNPYVSTCVFMGTPSVTLFPGLPIRRIESSPDGSGFTQAEKNLEAFQIDGLTRLTEGTAKDTVQIEGKELFLGWMRSQSLRDPAGEFSSINVPSLVLQGGKDTVVDAGQATEIVGFLQARGNPDVELAIYDNLDHYFGNLVEEPPFRRHPELDDRVLDKISSWFKNKLQL